MQDSAAEVERGAEVDGIEQEAVVDRFGACGWGPKQSEEGD